MFSSMSFELLNTDLATGVTPWHLKRPHQTITWIAQIPPEKAEKIKKSPENAKKNILSLEMAKIVQ